MNKPLDLKELMVDQVLLAKRLRQETSGEVMIDTASRGRYATDASIYQAMPVAVFIPKTAQDIASAIEIAAELGVPVLPRGGGTSQCGQTTGAALVIDNSKYSEIFLISILTRAMQKLSLAWCLTTSIPHSRNMVFGIQ